MRVRVLTLLGALAATLGLVACGGSDGGDKAADNAQQTVTVTVPEPKADSKAKDAPDDGNSSKKAAEEKKKEAPATDLDSGKVSKEAPASSGGKNDKGSTSGSGPGPGQVQATNDSPPEVTLAVIDAKSAYVKKTLVSRYAGLLDQLERSCSEARTQLAENALTASHDTAGRLSILEVLRQVVDAHPSGVCGPAFTAVSKGAGG